MILLQLRGTLEQAAYLTRAQTASARWSGLFRCLRIGVAGERNSRSTGPWKSANTYKYKLLLSLNLINYKAQVSRVVNHCTGLLQGTNHGTNQLDLGILEGGLEHIKNFASCHLTFGYFLPYPPPTTCTPRHHHYPFPNQNLIDRSVAKKDKQ